MEQRVFKTSPVKRILIHAAAFAAGFTFNSIFLADERSKVFYWALNIVIFAVCLMLIFFESETTIVCDEEGCLIKRKRFWKSSGESSGFRWSEVSETEYYADGETSREFYVEIDGVKRKILTADFSLDDTDSLIETVNQATPHLPYRWKKNEGLIGSTFEGRRFSKVAR